MNPIVFKHYKNDFFYKLKRTTSAVIGCVGLMFLMLGNKPRSANLLMKSYRIYNRNYLLNFILKKDLLNNETLLQLYSNEVSIEGAAGRTIVIKYPVVNDDEVESKGILIITFTSTFGFYLRKIDIELLSRYFHITLEPSWSGYLDADIIGWARQTNEHVYVQASELQDRVLINELGTNLIPVSFGASDWVDFQQFSPQDVEKCYDSVYVANMNPIKRIVRYLQAIRKISREDPSYRGCLVCAGWGSNSIDEIIELTAELGVESNIDVMFSLNKEQLRTVLSKSKTNLLLSFKEGSNRSMYESMFVNIPVICLSENIGVNKSYINEYTGMLVSDDYLESALMNMRKVWRQFSPRKWALENISATRTTEKLLSVIASHDGVDTSQWQPKIKVNNPEVSYYHHQGAASHEFNLSLLSIFLVGRIDKEEAAGKVKALREKFYALFS